jgi:hypothetical protein
MPKKPIKIEIIQEGEERFLLRIFADGTGAIAKFW